MNKLLKVLVVLPAILFIFIGLRWAVDPAGAGAALGMSLLSGVGLSSQIGDTGVFFLTMGMLMLTAVITGERRWFHVPALMLFGVAVFRTVAWLFHDAAFAVQSIAVEIVVGSLLLFAASRLGSGES
jgi:hypothetical protein